MAGKKKKKASANPARGFATVSQPSKSREPTLLEGEDLFKEQGMRSHDSPDGRRISEGERTASLAENGKDSISLEQMSPAELEAYLEEAELQNIIAENAPRIKSDAMRQASKLKTERRQLRKQADRTSVYGLSDKLIRDVAFRSSQMQAIPRKIGALDSQEEDSFLLKLWLLHDILKHLGLNSIDEVLLHVLHTWRQNGVDMPPDGVCGLDEAFSWYADIDGSEEMPLYDRDDTVETDDVSRDLAATALNGNPQKMQPLEEIEKKNGTNATNPSDMIVISGPASTSSDDNDDDDMNPDRLVDRWISLQTKLFENKRTASSENFHQKQAKDRRLANKIDTIERDILFDADNAQQRWRPLLRDLEIDSARQKKLKRARAHESPIDNHLGEDVLTDQAVLGNIFDDQDEENQTQLVTGSLEAIVQHDFGSWTGLHPGRLLEEVCADVAIRDGLKLRSLDGTSFSSRMQLNLNMRSATPNDDLSVQCLPQGIVYEGGNRWFSLKMESIATKNTSQSEAYLATLALFLLSSASTINVKIQLRLPKIWKEVLADLDRARDQLVFKQDIDKLRHLRSMIRQPVPTLETKLSTISVAPARIEADLALTKQQVLVKDHPEVAREKWSQRITTKAFALMQQTRRNLPVYGYKTQILQAFNENPILIVCADTGAGKSTQIPSYILEDELCRGQDYNILVTQPRRISAISIARRVSSELGEDKEAIGTNRSLIGYAIRMESKISATTRITFATTGVLLRMLQDSPDLNHLDCLILDEVHERTMDLDLLFIALKRLRLRRPSLKIVLMSATVDATKFSAYFGNAPILDLPGRTFPVELGFLEDAIEATLDVEIDGHGVETFNEDESDNATGDTDEHESSSTTDTWLEPYSVSTRRRLAQYNQLQIDYDLVVRLAVAIATKANFATYSNAILIFVPGIAEIRRLHNLMLSTRTFSEGWVLHMLHSSFSTQELENAFSAPPQGSRKIVIATNIAETGITIPDVTAVIDTCKEKVMRFDERRQTSRLTEGFIARASARQRKGRAARVQNGLCFHLVTRHYYETKLQDQPTPEMLRLSLQDPILRVKIWDLGAAEETLSAALDPPSAKNIRRAISKLQDVGAIDSIERLTPLGRNLAKLPLDVALGKMTIFGILFQCLDAIVTIVASFSTKSIFTKDQSTKSAPEVLFARGDSDFLTVYNAFSSWKKAGKRGAAHAFCQKHRLSHFQLRQLEEQRIQLLTYLADAGLMALSPSERATLQDARHNRSNLFRFEVPERYDSFSSDTIINAVITMALHPKVLRREGQGYRNVYSNQQLQIAPTSINRLAGRKTPDWLCYLEATQTRNGRLNAQYSSRVTQAMLLLLVGQVDFKFYAGVADLDHGRIRFSLRKWRELLALQRVRNNVQRVIHEFLERPEALLVAADQEWLEVAASVIEGPSQPGVELPLQLRQAEVT